MFGSLGFPEILFILALALIVFGPRRLPEVGRTIGRALGEFRRATGDLKRSFDQETSSFKQSTGLDSLDPGARPEARTPAPSSESSPKSEPEGVSEDDSDDAVEGRPES